MILSDSIEITALIFEKYCYVFFFQLEHTHLCEITNGATHTSGVFLSKYYGKNIKSQKKRALFSSGTIVLYMIQKFDSKQL